MKTVPLLYFKSRQQFLRNVEGNANRIGEALTRAGYDVPHLCWEGPGFDEGFSRALSAKEIEFVFVVGQYSLNVPVDGGRIWNHARFRNTTFFVFLIDTIIYELQPIVLELLRDAAGRAVFGCGDTTGQGLFQSFTRALGLRAHAFPFPCGGTPNPGRVTPWRERPFEVSFCGNIGLELMGLRPGKRIEEIFTDYKDGPAPYGKVVEAVKEIHRSPRGEMISQLMDCLGISPGTLADRQWLMLAWAVDSYFKRQRRIDIVKRFAKSKRTLNIFGTGWEGIADGHPNIILHGVRDWAAQAEVFDLSKILLHIESNTYGGANDRVFWATAHGALLLTQRNPTFDTMLVDGGGYLGFEQTGEGVLDVIDRPKDELEAIAASGSLKARAFHTWDHRIRDVVNYVRTLNEKPDTFEITDIRSKGERLIDEILRLDGKDDHVGVFTYLKGTPYDTEDALFALYRLISTGRFQSAFLVAKILAGAHLNNPTVDLARSLGGILFDNKGDEALGTERLVRWVARMPPEKLEQFRESVAIPVFRHALDAKVIGKSRDDETVRDFLAKIAKVRDIVMPGTDLSDSAQPATAPSRSPKRKSRASASA